MMKSSETFVNLAAALVAAQEDLANAKKDSQNPFFKTSYANLESAIAATKFAFSKHGLCVSQTTRTLDSGRMALVTLLIHSSGEWISGEMVMPEVADPQKIGSFITYYRRYSLMALAGICPTEDDDGNAAAQAVRDQVAAKADAERAKAVAAAEYANKTRTLQLALEIAPETKIKTLQWLQDEYQSPDLAQVPPKNYWSILNAAITEASCA